MLPVCDMHYYAVLQRTCPRSLGPRASPRSAAGAGTAALAGRRLLASLSAGGPGTLTVGLKLR